MTADTATDAATDRRPRRGLRRRVTGVAGLALATSLVLLTLLTFERVLAYERIALDENLQRQRDHVANELAVTAAVPWADAVDAVRRAAADFVRVDPATDDYFTVIEVGDERFVGRTDDPEVRDLVATGGLDTVTPELLATVPTELGDLRVLSATTQVAGTPMGRVTIAGPMGPVRSQAFEAAGRLLIAALASLAVGMVLVWVAMGRVLRPLDRLTDAAAAADADRPGTRVQVDGDDEVAGLAVEFNSMLARLEDAAREREELLATISHELRTPLAVAQGNLELAEGDFDGDPVAARRAVGVARAELVRTTRLVSDLLALGRSGHAGFLQRRPVRLTTLAREIEVRLDGLGIDTATVAPPLDAVVDVDADRLLQAVSNCVVNAIGHNPPGTTVDVRMELDPAAGRHGELVVLVDDDGQGVDPDVAAQAFAPFSRGSSSTTHGTGLGLAVVDAVARAHDGSARLLPTERGTLVEIRLGLTPDRAGRPEESLSQATAPDQVDAPHCGS